MMLINGQWVYYFFALILVGVIKKINKFLNIPRDAVVKRFYFCEAQPEAVDSGELPAAAVTGEEEELKHPGRRRSLRRRSKPTDGNVTKKRRRISPGTCWFVVSNIWVSPSL